MREIILLLPGLGSPGWSMAMIASRLRRQGFETRTIGYAATGRNISAVASDVAEQLSRSYDNTTIHIVGHSLGGLVGRCLLEQARDKVAFGRLVMLGTPLLGHAFADYLKNKAVGRFFFGKIWPDLSSERCDKNHMPINGHDIGMIAGSVPGGRLLYRRETDGVVSVSATLGKGLTDHATISASHGSLLLSTDAASLAGRFLKTGTFKPRKAAFRSR